MSQVRTLVAALLAIALLAACGSSPSPPNLLLIVVDTLRIDHLPFHGYDRDTAPRLGRLASRGFVFEGARSAGGWTKPSVASILSGLYPTRHGVVHADSARDADLPDLPAWLSARGFHVFFVNGGNFFLGKHFGFPSAFASYALVSPPDAAGVVEGFRGLLEARPAERPFFAYVHFMDPHLPYNRNPYNEAFTAGASDAELQPGEIQARLVRERDGRGELSEDDRTRIRDLYDGQIRWVDEQIGELLDGLASQGLLEETLVVVTSDHGEEFWEHGGFEHGHALYPETTRVPLLLAGPGVRPGRSARMVSGVDVAPTLLEAAGLDPAPLGLDGRSLWPIVGGEPAAEDRSLFASGTLYGPEKYSILRDELQLIENTAEDEGKWPPVGPEPEAPLEWIGPEGAAGASAQQREALRSALARHRAEAVPAARAPSRVEIDGELAEQLESIGYAR